MVTSAITHNIMNTATCPNELANLPKNAPILCGNFGDAVFEGYLYLFDYEAWLENIGSSILRLIPKYIQARKAEVIENIQALQARGFEFEPLDDDEWNAFCDRVQGRNILDE